MSGDSQLAVLHSGPECAKLGYNLSQIKGIYLSISSNLAQSSVLSTGYDLAIYSKTPFHFCIRTTDNYN
tara:strand:+ start:36 stop:242 length:207 start_codon:yes stop_codon:yes gene_type:complete